MMSNVSEKCCNGKLCDPGVSAVRFCSEVTKAKLSRRRAASLFLHIPGCQHIPRSRTIVLFFAVDAARTAPLQTPGHLQDNGGVADVLPESAVHMLRLLDLHHGAGDENECDIRVHISPGSEGHLAFVDAKIAGRSRSRARVLPRV